jgi:predicted thioesterase
MAKELLPGTEGRAAQVVEDSDLACALSDEYADCFPRVFATAEMVALMEMAASRAMAGILEEGELTAGVLVNITHTAAMPPGTTVGREPVSSDGKGSSTGSKSSRSTKPERSDVGSTTAPWSGTTGFCKERRSAGVPERTHSARTAAREKGRRSARFP